MSLLDRIFARRGGESRMNVDQWITDYMVPSTFNYGGTQYLYGGTGYSRMTIGEFVTELSNSLPAYSAAVRGCPPAFAAQMVRALVISQARFTFRNRPSSGQPRRTFGNRNLSILEKPGNGQTTAKLLGKMEWHVGLAGNAYVYRQAGRNPGDPPRLRLLRPDWVGILYGSQREPEDPQWALDSELIGYVYWNGGFGGGYDAWTLLPSEVAHWAPVPDPEAAGLGMSWITPALREMQGDKAATEHKLRFFANGATPSLVVTGIAGQGGQPLTRDQFDDVVNMMERRHAGTGNAYKTLYLTAGADARVIGTDLKQIDFKATQGAGETRISFLSRVPAPLLGISEGLAGSSLNAGNFGMARRIFADSWIYPVLQDLAGTFAPIVDVPADAELWYDTSDMPILREDSKDQADILSTQMQAISSGVNAGYKPESVVAAIQNNDLGQLQHTGLYSVQLQPPQPGQEPAGATAPADTATDSGALDETLRTILRTLQEMRSANGFSVIGEPSTERPKPPAPAPPARPPAETGSVSPKKPDLRRYIDPIAAARGEVAKLKAIAGAPAAAERAAQILAPKPSDDDVLAKARQALSANTDEDNDPDDDGDLDENTYALLVALAEYSAELANGTRAQKFDPAKHPRGKGGRFRTLVDRLKDALADHHASGGKTDPFPDFDREQLRRAAKARGISLTRGEDRDSIAKKLVADLDGKPAPAAPAAPATPAKATAKAAAKSVKKAAAAAAPPNDGLDAMDEPQLKKLAVEFELDTSLSRDDLIDALRREGAVSPDVRLKRNNEYSDLQGRLKSLGRREPADNGPLLRAAEALAAGTDAKVVAKQLRQDADAVTRKEDADTLRFLAGDLTRKKATVPPYINDKGNIDLAKLAELNGIDIKRWMPADKAPIGGPAMVQFREEHPFDLYFRQFVQDLGDPQARGRTAAPSRAKSVRLARETAEMLRRRYASAVSGVGIYALPNRAAERKKMIADGPAAIRDLERLADLAAAAKVPPKKRAVTLGGTTLGEIVPIDETRFKSRRITDVVSHRGQHLPADFRHTGSGTALILDRKAPKRPGLSDAETRALDLYTTGVVADGLNGSLRKGHNVHGEVKSPAGTVDLDQVSRDLDSAIADSKLTQDTVLWRGSVASTADYRRLVPGAVYTDLGYLSTSLDEQGARQTIDWRQRNGTIPAGRKPVLFKILAPAGTNAAVGHERVKEAVLPRGQELRVVRVDDSLTPPVVVMEAVPRQVDPGVVRGRPIVDDFDYDGTVRNHRGGGVFSSGGGDRWLGEIQKAQGYDGKPKVVSRQEMDDAIQGGATEVFRAVRGGPGGKTSAELTEEYRSGALFPGNGVYGSGTYTSPQRETAKRYGDEKTMLRIALRRDAKVVSYADLLKLRPRTGITASASKLADERQAELDRVDPSDTAAIKAIIDKYAALAARQGARSQIAGDLGRVAALLGYDAIYIPGDYRGAGAKMDGQTEYVILNRTATLVEEAAS